MIVGRSPERTASTAVRPRPWMPKVVSVITVPPSAPPTSSPAMVTIGVIAARSACRPYTCGLRQALGPRGADEVLGQRLQHLRPGQPGVDRGEQEGQRHPGQHQPARPLQRILEQRRVAAAPAGSSACRRRSAAAPRRRSRAASRRRSARSRSPAGPARCPGAAPRPCRARPRAPATAPPPGTRCSASPAAPGRRCR